MQVSPADSFLRDYFFYFQKYSEQWPFMTTLFFWDNVNFECLVITGPGQVSQWGYFSCACPTAEFLL